MNKTTAPLDDADVMSFHTDDNKSAGPRRDTNFYDEGDSEHKEGEEGGEVGEIGQMEEKGNEAGQTQRRDNAFSQQPLSARYSSFMIKDHSVYVPRRNAVSARYETLYFEYIFIFRRDNLNVSSVKLIESQGPHRQMSQTKLNKLTQGSLMLTHYDVISTQTNVSNTPLQQTMFTQEFTSVKQRLDGYTLQFDLVKEDSSSSKRT
ncbi:hypothetical protein FGO68_gene15083 [Halteria grandinella]|uniref:Uncharacterized protein n=1 Tax=Halteria grandinella TaxID=5974 RepID=A0A8J8T271_HALGN|nr:hypothetical protein FGO68_gene15083 [Halteria grandinella]